MTGIAAAYYLAKSGRFNVTLFEKNDHLGGLSDYYQWQDVIWDRYYHVILSTDNAMLEFIAELNLENQLFWRKTKSGFYSKEKLVSFSSTIDFIKFPFMSLWQKFRMGLGILYSTRIKDPSKLDKIYVKRWLTKVFGRRVYENIWDPLLRSKLGDARERTSAAFIWATITRLYGARSSEHKQELMGHIHGGYHIILNAAQRRLSDLGVKVVTKSPVLKLKNQDDLPDKSSDTINNSDQLNKHNKLDKPNEPNQSNEPNEPNKPNNPINLLTDSSSFEFDKILLTVDCPEVRKIITDYGENLYWEQLQKVEYLGVICVFLILKHQLSPYYVINLLDKDLPFTGIIEATNVVYPEELGGKHLVYLPKYVPPGDPLKKLNDEEIIEYFVGKLKKVYPDLNDDSILHKKVFRSEYVQPLQELNYLDRKTGIRTPVTGVYLANTSMIYNSTLNNNAAISLAKNAVKIILEE